MGIETYNILSTKIYILPHAYNYIQVYSDTKNSFVVSWDMWKKNGKESKDYEKKNAVYTRIIFA